MLPDWMSGGRRIEGNSIYSQQEVRGMSITVQEGERGERYEEWGDLTSRLSSVSRTATPASTLPTVSDTSILSVYQDGSLLYISSIASMFPRDRDNDGLGSGDK